jgi:DNA (cytosine-5)-methyltransferase 1
LLAGGFPCQPFSNAGLKRGFDDARGTLFFDVARITEHHRPKVLLLENVKGFARHDKGNTLRVVTEILADLGYSLTWKILNAKDFGLPQNRERIYMVAIRDDLEGVFEKFSFPTPPSSPTKLADVLEKMSVDAKYTISDRLWEGHQRRKREHRLRGNGFGYSLFNADSIYTSTISARYYKDGSEILVSQTGKNPRKITPREAARLQGFPDAYQIVVGDSQAYKQFGNSVAVPVVSAIASKIAEAIGT